MAMSTLCIFCLSVLFAATLLLRFLVVSVVFLSAAVKLVVTVFQNVVPNSSVPKPSAIMAAAIRGRARDLLELSVGRG